MATAPATSAAPTKTAPADSFDPYAVVEAYTKAKKAFDDTKKKIGDVVKFLNEAASADGTVTNSESAAIKAFEANPTTETLDAALTTIDKSRLPKKLKRNWLWIAIGIVGIILLVGLAFFVVLPMFGNTGGSKGLTIPEGLPFVPRSTPAPAPDQVSPLVLPQTDNTPRCNPADKVPPGARVYSEDGKIVSGKTWTGSELAVGSAKNISGMTLQQVFQDQSFSGYYCRVK